MQRWRTPVLAGLAVAMIGLGVNVWRETAVGHWFARVRNFPVFASKLHDACTLADAWACATESEWSDYFDELMSKCRKLRTDGQFTEFDTPQEQFWIPEADLPTLPEILGGQARDVYTASEVAIEPGDVVIDCGAYFGVFTRRALESGAALVIAIEPSPEPLWCLRKNFQQEIAERRVAVVPKGVWNEEATLPLTVEEGCSSAAASVVRQRGTKISVIQLTTIDKLVEDLRLDRVDLIKMDIEGAELEALAGASQTIRKHRPRLAVTLEHNPEDLETIPRLLGELCSDCVLGFGSCIPMHGRIQPEMVYLW